MHARSCADNRTSLLNSAIQLLFLVGMLLAWPAFIHADDLPPCPDADIQKVYADDQKYNYQLLAQQRADMFQKSPPLDVKLSGCLQQIQDFFNVIITINDPLNIIGLMLRPILDQLVNAVCNAITTTIQNFWSNMCIPMPDFNFNPNLNLGNGPRRNSCNGSFISVRQGPPLPLRGTITTYLEQFSPPGKEGK